MNVCFFRGWRLVCIAAALLFCGAAVLPAQQPVVRNSPSPSGAASATAGATGTSVGTAGAKSSIPTVNNVIARLVDPAVAGKGLSLVDKGENISYTKARYSLVQNGLFIDVYVSSDPRGFVLGASNLRCAANAVLTGVDAVISKAEYALLDGRPSYLIARSDGLWFLFVCPDRVFDLCGFFKSFLENYAFFESHVPGAKPFDLLPAVIGRYS